MEGLGCYSKAHLLKIVNVKPLQNRQKLNFLPHNLAGNIFGIKEMTEDFHHFNIYQAPTMYQMISQVLYCEAPYYVLDAKSSPLLWSGTLYVSPASQPPRDQCYYS